MNRRDHRAPGAGDTADLIAMRQGLMSRTDFEARHGITDVRDTRHAAWYAGQPEARIERRVQAPAPRLPGRPRTS